MTPCVDPAGAHGVESDAPGHLMPLWCLNKSTHCSKAQQTLGNMECNAPANMSWSGHAQYRRVCALSKEDRGLQTSSSTMRAFKPAAASSPAQSCSHSAWPQQAFSSHRGWASLAEPARATQAPAPFINAQVMTVASGTQNYGWQTLCCCGMSDTLSACCIPVPTLFYHFCCTHLSPMQFNTFTVCQLRH